MPSSSRPRIAAIAPVPIGTAACIAAARAGEPAAQRSFSASTPAATSAGIFAETVTRDDGRLPTALLQPQAPGCDTGSEHYRLGVDRLRQQLGRAIGNHLPEIVAKRWEASSKGANDGGIAVCRHHSD